MFVGLILDKLFNYKGIWRLLCLKNYLSFMFYSVSVPFFFCQSVQISELKDWALTWFCSFQERQEFSTRALLSLSYSFIWTQRALAPGCKSIPEYLDLSETSKTCKAHSLERTVLIETKCKLKGQARHPGVCSGLSSGWMGPEWVSTSLCVCVTTWMTGSVLPPCGTCVFQQSLWGIRSVNNLHQLVQHHGNVRLHFRS